LTACFTAADVPRARRVTTNTPTVMRFGAVTLGGTSGRIGTGTKHLGGADGRPHDTTKESDEHRIGIT